jgi:hypothetical protein
LAALVVQKVSKFKKYQLMKTKISIIAIIAVALLTLSFGFTSKSKKGTEVNKSEISQSGTPQGGFASERMF